MFLHFFTLKVFGIFDITVFLAASNPEVHGLKNPEVYRWSTDLPSDKDMKTNDKLLSEQQQFFEIKAGAGVREGVSEGTEDSV